MMEITLQKVHGSMNTFYMLEGPERNDYDQLVLQLAAIEPEIDGLLVVLPSEKADAKMRVFNRDGSEASMCGNGLRCVARFVCERDHIEEAMIETMKATLKVKKQATQRDGIARYSVEISPVLFDLKELPMKYEENEQWLMKPLPFISEEIAFSAVAVPNPHLIGVVSEDYLVDQSHQQQWAERFNGPNEYFPDGVNVSYVTKVEEGIFVRTFERGVGFTNACGTAMTASALISCLSGLVPFGNVLVFNPGGMVECQIDKKGQGFELLLTGNATVLSTHQFSWEPEIEQSQFVSTIETDEQSLYEKFIEQTSSVSDQFAQ